MALSGVQAVRYLKAAVLLCSLALAVSLIASVSKQLHPKLEASPRENELDLQLFAEAKQSYQTTVEMVLAQKKPELCQTLPDLILPYHRTPEGRIKYILSQSDGPTVPERESYWPRKQCLFAYALNQDSGYCGQLFQTFEEQTDCQAELTLPPTHLYKILTPLSSDSEQRLGKKRFYSTASKGSLPYYILYPEKPVRGILIYLHGAGGGLEQGQLDGTYKDSFKKLKQLLKEDLGFLYITPSLSNFGEKGGQDTRDLARELRARYPRIPIYLAGASAGGRATFYALKDTSELFQGAIALCPAIDSSIAVHNWSKETSIPLWISQGTRDQFIPIDIIDEFITRLKQQVITVTYIRIPDGDHGAPIDQIDWKTALVSFQK